ncbi:DUF805 domain-containing protein [Krasilnikoviella flava]|uniref:Uncharacterized membrane protein YhaH, DUF805 family n=1 Tax=Krasilnikoviella flava TaxID=526729 RepID=A0A1T5JXX8_9MICO|nr:DUF805 domain-containing protein [Krasilnikoviella flava]SKC56210.1 Uncharacterized membrane protein YhaH, DUF805 family [Krasilnikoviella flava]
MSFPDAIKSVFSQYATFSGRARRSEFWFWYLFLVIISAVGGILLGIVGSASLDTATGTFGAGFYVLTALISIVWLALLLPTLAVMVRRLHDQDKSGFFWFMTLIPLAGPIIMIVFYATAGTVGPNRFGPDPKGLQAPAGQYGAPAV